MENKPPFLALYSQLECTRKVLDLTDAGVNKLDITFPPGVDLSHQVRPQEFSTKEHDLTKPVDLPPLDLSRYPDRNLIALDENFSFDYFVLQGRYWSKELRECLDIEKLNIQFLPIDDSKSVAKVRAKEYMTLNVMSYRPAIDLEKSSGLHYSDLHLYDGKYETGEEHIVSVDNIVWKEDFVADVPIFHVMHYPIPFVTRAFAKEILNYEFTGIAFLDLDRRELVTSENII